GACTSADAPTTPDRTDRRCRADRPARGALEISGNEHVESRETAAPRRNRGRVRSLPACHRRRKTELPQHDDGVRHAYRRDPLGACSRVFLSGGRRDRAGAAGVIAAEVLSMVVSTGQGDRASLMISCRELTSRSGLTSFVACAPLTIEGS